MGPSRYYPRDRVSLSSTLRVSMRKNQEKVISIMILNNKVNIFIEKCDQRSSVLCSVRRVRKPFNCGTHSIGFFWMNIKWSSLEKRIKEDRPLPFNTSRKKISFTRKTRYKWRQRTRYICI